MTMYSTALDFNHFTLLYVCTMNNVLYIHPSIHSNIYSRTTNIIYICMDLI